MMNNKLGRTIIGGLLLVTVGCTTDPLTKTLKDNKFVPIVPVSARRNLGDLHRRKDMTQPVKLADSLLGTTEISKLMQSAEDSVVLPGATGNNAHNIQIAADVIGYVTAELASEGAKKFEVRMGTTYQYILTEDDFEKIILPALRKQYQPEKLDGCYMVIGLLKVSSLEYKLENSYGAQVKVEPEGAIEKAVQAKLGAGWSASGSKTLTSTNPIYVGCRIARIRLGPAPSDLQYNKRLSFPSSSREQSFVLEEVDDKELREEQMRLIQKRAP